MRSTRRNFLKDTGYITAGFFGLQRFLESVAFGQDYQSETDKLGKLVPDPNRIMDLPEGFSYRILSIVGDPMSDGLRTPGLPDGMGAFEGADGRVILVRNHELEDIHTFEGAYGVTNELIKKLDPAKVYDAGKGKRPQLGGTTTLVYDPNSGNLERHFLSLAGTTRNCAGGPTPWNTWISCEETVIRPFDPNERRRGGGWGRGRGWGRRPEDDERGDEPDEETPEKEAEESAEPATAQANAETATTESNAETETEGSAEDTNRRGRERGREREAPEPPEAIKYVEKAHGYVFEVPASAEIGLCDPVPLKAMGRFNHEAVAVDPRTGIVYQTEDRDDGLITRFIPTEPGNLRAGGVLQALVVKDVKSCDTRNWPDTGKPKLQVGEAMAVEWMTLKDIDNPRDRLRADAYEDGAARFARGEGMWYGNDKIYFACTSGGIAKSGQIFIYSPSADEGTESEKDNPGTLMLYLEPNNTHLLQYGDNLTVAPWGDIVLCEDGADEQYLRGVTPEGKIYTLARGRYTGNPELCGVCFAPNHPTLFVNIFRPGMTLAITGPWDKLRPS